MTPSRPESVELERNALFHDVWSRPCTQIAAGLGISSSALKRICLAMDVPTPLAGHWAQVQFGKAMKKPVLPKEGPETKLKWQVDQANSLWGQGSMIARMVAAFMAGNPAQKLYAAGVPEPTAGVVATGTITVAAAPTAAGLLNLYIAGQRVQIGVASTDTMSNVATKIAAAVAASPDLPVTASVTGAAVTLTTKWKGASGNDIVVGDTYLGAIVAKLDRRPPGRHRGGGGPE